MSADTTVGAALPADVAALAEAEGLGRLRQTFLPKRFGKGRIIGLCIATVVLAFAVVPSVLFVLILLKSPDVSKKQAARRLHIFENGLILADRTGPVGSVRWASASVLQEIVRRTVNGVHVGTNYTYTVAGPNGSHLKITQFFDGVKLWGPAIQEGITTAQLPNVLAALEAGETIRFGDLAVSVGGVATAKRGGTAWSEIQAVQVRQGAVYLRKAGKTLAWSNTNVKDIPNFFLFMAVVGALTAQR